MVVYDGRLATGQWSNVQRGYILSTLTLRVRIPLTSMSLYFVFVLFGKIKVIEKRSKFSKILLHQTILWKGV